MEVIATNCLAIEAMEKYHIEKVGSNGKYPNSVRMLTADRTLLSTSSERSALSSII
jgi:hypothetical protein